MTANVSIITNKREQVLCAPNTALKFTPNTDGTKYKTQGLWVLEDGKPTRHDISLGASNDLFSELTSENIKENAEIIVGIKGKTKQKGAKTPRPPRMF